MPVYDMSREQQLSALASAVQTHKKVQLSRDASDGFVKLTQTLEISPDDIDTFLQIRGLKKALKNYDEKNDTINSLVDKLTGREWLVGSFSDDNSLSPEDISDVLAEKLTGLAVDFSVIAANLTKYNIEFKNLLPAAPKVESADKPAFYHDEQQYVNEDARPTGDYVGKLAL